MLEKANKIKNNWQWVGVKNTTNYNHTFFNSTVNKSYIITALCLHSFIWKLKWKKKTKNKKRMFLVGCNFFTPFCIFYITFLFIGNTKIVERKYIYLYIVFYFCIKIRYFYSEFHNAKKKLHLTRVLWYSVFNNLLLFDVVVFSVFTQHIILCYIQLNNAIVCNRIEKAGSIFERR